VCFKAESPCVWFCQRFAKVSRGRYLSYCDFAKYYSANAVIDTPSNIVDIGACYAQEENQGKSELPEIIAELLLCVELCDFLVEC